MINKIRKFQGLDKRLGDINAQLNADGFRLPWDEKKIEHFFRNTGNKIVTADWNDEEGNKVRLIFKMQKVAEKLDDSKLIVFEVEYYTIEEIVNQIRKQLKGQQ
jgi:hypothetical protein